MLWIHDLPEIFIETEKDITSVEKETDSKLLSSVNDSEELVAKDILNSEDLFLYKEFEQSKKALKTGVINDETTFIGLIARVLDTTDGNMCFHYFLTEWIKSNKYNSNKLPPINALTFTFRFTESARNSIRALKLAKTESSLLIKLLDEQMAFIKYLWCQVDTTRIPQQIKEELS